MIIPIDAVDTETLHSLVEAFVLREGTEYGAEDVTMETKVTQVLDALKSGEAVLVYSEPVSYTHLTLPTTPYV